MTALESYLKIFVSIKGLFNVKVMETLVFCGHNLISTHLHTPDPHKQDYVDNDL